MQRGTLKITTRSALAQYALQVLRIDPHIVHAKAEAQQITVANLEDIKPWLFG